ncbi:YybS family protein [Virgibacillus kimchii]
MNQSKRVTDGALLMAIFILLMLITVFVPFISLFSLFLLPVPIVLFASRYDWKSAALMVVATIILSMLLATLASLPIAVMMALGGVLIGNAIYINASAYDTWARGTLGFVAGLLFAFVFAQLIFQVNLLEQLEQTMNESLEMTGNMMGQFGVQEQMEETQAMMQDMIGVMIDLFPVFLAGTAVLLALISQWVSYKIINRVERKDYRFPPFRQLRFPISLIWVYFVAFILSFLVAEPGSTLYIAVQNMFVLVGLLLAVQGFSFIFFYAHHKNMSKALPVISIILTVLFPMIFLYLIRIIGIIDLGFGLRDRLADKKD